MGSLSNTAAQRKADLNKLADDFESAFGEIIQTVSPASSKFEASGRLAVRERRAFDTVRAA